MTNESDLRSLAQWSDSRDKLAQVKGEIKDLRMNLKSLQATALRLLDEIDGLVDLLPEERRFWSKVDVVDDDTSCWEWTGSRKPVSGEEYGTFKTPEGSTVGAHRVAYLFTHGTLPEVGRHTCDNPPCVRPSHIINGTHADNMRDRHERGRYAPRLQRGESNNAAVLTEDLVRRGRILYLDGHSDAEVAAILGVPKAAIAQAIIGRSWGHVAAPGPVTERRQHGKLTANQRAEVIQRRQEGHGVRAIAEAYGITDSAVYYILRKHAAPPS